jgi:hypothetical protein
MKKTYNVYSIFEKTRVTTGLRSIAMMFVLLVCFLSYSTESSAQAYNTEPSTNGVVAGLDLSIIKGFTFAEDSEGALVILKREAQSLQEAPVTNGAAAEASFASKKVFLDTAIQSLLDGREVSDSMLEAYQGTALYVDNVFSIAVDVDGILTTYAGLLQ